MSAKVLVALVVLAASSAFAQVTVIQGSDTLTASRSTLNNNFSYLNGIKVAKYSGAGVPGAVAGNLFGDLYLNTTAGTTYQCFSNPGPCSSVAPGSWVLIGGSATPGGSSGQVQWNNSGVLDGFTTSGDLTLNTSSGVATLANTAVSPGSYGDSTHVGQFTVDSKGRLTAAANVAIAGGGGGTSALSGLTPATSSNTISNGDNAQFWNWSLISASKSAFTIGETVAATAAGTPVLLNVQTLAASTANPFQATAGGASSGVRLDTTGKLSKIGTGSVNADALNSTALSSLATGLLKNTTGTGVPSIAAAGTDYQAPLSVVNDTNVSGSVTGAVLTLGWSGTLAKARIIGTAVYNDQANTWTAGVQSFAAATSLISPIGAGLAPTANGSMAYDSTANLYKFGFNGSNKIITAFSGAFADNDCPKYQASTGTLVTSGGACGGGGGGVSGLTTGKIPKAASPTSLADSNLTENADGSDNAGKALTWAAATKPTFNSGGTTTCDLSLSNLCEVDFGAGNTTLALSNPHGSGPYWLRSCQDSVGSRTYTFPGTAKGFTQPDPTAGTTNCTEQPFTYDGTNYQGNTSAVPTSAWHGISSPEGSAPTGITGTDFIYADSSAHRWKANNNNAGAVNFVLSGVDVNTLDQVTATHLSAPLPIAQGGTNGTDAADNGGIVWSNGTQYKILPHTTTAGLGLFSGNAATPAWSVGPPAQKFFGTAAPGSVSGNLPGDFFSDTTNHNDYWCNATSGTAAPACTSVATGGWTLLNGGGGSSAWSALTSGTNTTMAAVNGTGSSLAFTGTATLDMSADTSATAFKLPVNTACGSGVTANGTMCVDSAIGVIHAAVNSTDSQVAVWQSTPTTADMVSVSVTSGRMLLTDAGFLAANVVRKDSATTFTAKNVLGSGGLLTVNPSFTLGTVTANRLACFTGSNTIGNCTGLPSNNFTGVFADTSGNVVPGGQVTSVALDATVNITAGDILCASSTSAGLAHDNGSVACTTGEWVGIVTTTASSVSLATTFLRLQ